MGFYRMKKNRSSFVIVILTLLLSYMCIMDVDMGSSLYERIIVCADNGNWALLFSFFSTMLANSFYKNKYVKNLVGIADNQRRMSISLGIISFIYVLVIIGLNIIFGIGYSRFTRLELPVGMGRQEFFYLLLMVFKFSVIDFAIITIIVIVENAFSGFVFGFIWWLFIDSVIDIGFISSSTISEWFKYVVVFLTCVLINFCVVKKKELK